MNNIVNWAKKLRAKAGGNKKTALIGVAVIAAAAALGVLAGMAISNDNLMNRSANFSNTATAIHDRVERTLDMNVSIQYETKLAGVNMMGGIVTWTSENDFLNNGDAIYAVDNSKVYAVEGKMPFYRTLTSGMSGEDAMQLNAMLVERKLLEGPAGDTFNAASSAAVRAWQQSNGENATGTIDFSRLIAIAKMPAAAKLSDELQIGRLASFGSGGIYATYGDPVFSIAATPEMAVTIPRGGKGVDSVWGRDMGGESW